MMFDLILAKFFKRDHKEKELSYTGEMVKYDKALIGTREAKALTVTDYPTIDAPILEAKDVRVEELLNEWESEPTRVNQWLEGKFASEIKAESLNLLGAPNIRDKYIHSKTGDIVARKEKDTFLMTNKELKEHELLIELSELDTTSFGTKKEMLADQKWHARYNLSKQVGARAEIYYEETHVQILEWYHEQAFLNMQYLIDCIQKGVCDAPGLTWDKGGFGTVHIKKDNLLSIIEYPMKNLRDNIGTGYFSSMKYSADYLRFHNGYIRKYGGRYLCYFDSTPSTYRCRFYPTNHEGIAVLCGCKIEDLPEPLQHYKYQKSYGGNFILDRLDPMDWVCKDPWTGKDMGVSIYISKRTYARIKKNIPLEDLLREPKFNPITY